MTNETLPASDTLDSRKCRDRLEYSKEEKKALDRLMKLLQQLQKIDGNMPLHYALMWLLVARSATKGQTLKALALTAETSKTTTERFKGKFMDLGLIEVIEDRLEGRSFLYMISKKGHIRLNQLQVLTTAYQMDAQKN